MSSFEKRAVEAPRVGSSKRIDVERDEVEVQLARTDLLGLEIRNFELLAK